MLDALPQHQFDTTTPWTEGSDHYQGVLLSRLLEHLGASGREVTAAAFNEHKTNIERQVLQDYPVIIASGKNGEPMRIRDKGPLWIIFPLSQFEELNQPKHHGAMVWQLRRLTLD